MVSALITTRTAHMGVDTITMEAMGVGITRPTTVMAPTGRAPTAMATNIARRMEAMEEDTGAMEAMEEDTGTTNTAHPTDTELATEAMATTTHRHMVMEATGHTARNVGKTSHASAELLFFIRPIAYGDEL